MSEAGLMNQQYGVEHAVSFEPGVGGLTLARLKHEAGEATIYLHGAHIASWRPTGQDPVLWVSDQSFFAPDKPIRGGVPVCFPWFANHPTDPTKPGHGFARIKQWDVKATGIDDDGAAFITLELSDDAMTLCRHDKNTSDFNRV